RQTAKRGGTEVLCYGIDRDNLFAVITTLLDQLALDIVNARVMSTSARFSLSSFLVLEQDGSPVEEGQRWDEVISTLREAMTQEGDQPLKVTRSMPRRHKHFDTTTQVYFTQEPNLHRTAMRLVTLDRPGLLSDVGQAFDSCKIRLQHAKITTLGAEVEDIFFITDRKNNPILDESQLECLKQAVAARMPE
ncbi:MAG: [protein-PII] uridylyltransferase, partial [Candidatus Thiodiazotropha sp.]